MSSEHPNNIDPEISRVFSMFFKGTPVSVNTVDTSRGEADFRNTFIITALDGERCVLKFASNDFTFPEKIRVWQRTVEEYRALGYYCPRIFQAADGSFPVLEYKGHSCTVYGEEYSKYRSLEDRAECGEGGACDEYDAYIEEIWGMTAKIAAKRLDYTEYPSAFCLFETFCPSDEVDEVLENALEWKRTADALPKTFSARTQRIWELWLGNRERLRPLYAKLPTSVFQADLNSTNILVDDEGAFKGVYDFNLCGREVFLNYLMRENDADTIPRALRAACAHYVFSDEEKAAATPLFRCLKPLWYPRVKALKEAGDDEKKIAECLDITERYLTEEKDLAAFMG